MKIQLKLDKRKETNQGYPIKIYVYLKKGSEKWVNTGHYTFLKDFNIEAFEPLKSHPNFIYLYEWIYTKKVEILKVKNTSKKKIAGNGIVNECEVLKTYKGKVKQTVNIYDMTYVIDQTSVGYIEGSKPLIPLREYIVFLKKSKKVNVKNTYIQRLCWFERKLNKI